MKFVHHKAMEYDLGVYFEANGHGTVLFHPSLLERLRGLNRDALTVRVGVSSARSSAVVVCAAWRALLCERVCVRVCVACPLKAEGRAALQRLLAACQLINQVQCCTLDVTAVSL